MLHVMIFADIVAHRRPRGFANEQAIPRGVVWPFIFIVLLGVTGSGCDRKPDASSPTQTAQLEGRPTTPPRKNLAPSDPAASQVAVAVSRGAEPNSDKTHDFRLPVYELTMDPKDLRALERNPRSDETHPATFLFGAEVHTNVQVRFRGDWARTWPKKPLKIFFSRDQPFQGHHSLNLNSAWRDPAFVRETLAYHVYAVCGVPASRSRMVRLHLNGQFRGLYAEVEQVDKTLLSRFNLKGASLFKAASKNNQSDERDLGGESAFARHYENETQKTNGVGELQLFCHELATATNVLDFFTRRVDLEKYINYLAAGVLVQNWDCYDKNHFVVFDRRGSQKWFSLPWDLDRTFGDHWHESFDSADLPILLGTRQKPRSASWNRLQDRFFSEPVLRARFLDRLAELLEKEFSTEKLFPILDRLESDIGPEAALDRRRWPGPDEDLHRGIAGVKSYIERRRACLQRELKQFLFPRQ